LLFNTESNQEHVNEENNCIAYSHDVFLSGLCGTIPKGNDFFYLNSGNGSIIEYHLDGKSKARSIVENQDLRWDNHMNLTG
jgi:hypothetical protein